MRGERNCTNNYDIVDTLHKKYTIEIAWIVAKVISGRKRKHWLFSKQINKLINNILFLSMKICRNMYQIHHKGTKQKFVLNFAKI